MNWASRAIELRKTLVGYKVHALLALGIVVVVLNKVMPDAYSIEGLDKSKWLVDVYQLLVGHAARAALEKLRKPESGS